MKGKNKGMKKNFNNFNPIEIENIAKVSMMNRNCYGRSDNRIRFLTLSGMSLIGIVVRWALLIKTVTALALCQLVRFDA